MKDMVAARERLASYLGYLDSDPDNANLLRDAAGAAMEANDPVVAHDLFGRLDRIGALLDDERNQAGLAAMQSGDQLRAQQLFRALLSGHPDDSGLKFNMAWSLALAGDFEGAQSQLDKRAIDTLPQAAMLDLQLRHEKGDFEDAAHVAQEYLDRHGDYPPLLAAVSVLAMDVDDEELARECAVKAGDHPDALTTLATLALDQQENDEARIMFERALHGNPHSPRARVGLGLAEMAAGNTGKAVVDLDRGAEMFGDHLGSWIAAGWGYFLSADLAAARARFQTALDLDDSFAESHGSLAVVDILEGELESGRRRIEIARRLDRDSFSAAFAQMLFAAGEGDTEKAQRIFELALKQPIDANGRTIATALGMIAMGRD